MLSDATTTLYTKNKSVEIYRIEEEIKLWLLLL